MPFTFSWIELFSTSYLLKTFLKRGIVLRATTNSPNPKIGATIRKMKAIRPPMTNAMSERENEHQRAADRGADDHHVGHLHVGHVGRHPRHERGSGELVNVFKRIGLYLRKTYLSAGCWRVRTTRCAGGPASHRTSGTIPPSQLRPNHNPQ